jgi:hypothetical protein
MTTNVLDPVEQSPRRFTSTSHQWVRRIVKSAIREPLVHFLILGALIFIGNAVVTPAIPADKRIDVTLGLRKTITDTFTRERGRAPTANEMKELRNASNILTMGEVTFSPDRYATTYCRTTALGSSSAIRRGGRERLT